MSIDSTNPYQPPRVPDPDSESSTTAAFRSSTIWIPPLLTVGSTLVFWIGLAAILGPIVRTLSNAGLMFVWSTTLLLSVAVSTYLIARVWPNRLSPLSMSTGFVLFGVVFCLAEGDTSNGTDWLHMSILYGTLAALPLMVFAVTRILQRQRNFDARESR